MSEAIAAFLGATIGSALLLLRDWLSNARQTRSRAKYLAIRVIMPLDRFVDQCAIVSLDDGYLEGNRGDAVATTKTPAPIKFPDDIDWKSIDHSLAFNLLSLENKINDAEQSINDAADFASDPDYEEYFETRRSCYARIGLEAAKLGMTLRDTHDLPRRTFENWNSEKILRETLQTLQNT